MYVMATGASGLQACIPHGDMFSIHIQHNEATSMRMTSSLVKALSTSIPLMGHGRFVEYTARMQRSGGVLMSIGLESGDMKELTTAETRR